jgi:hypothetical protein
MIDLVHQRCFNHAMREAAAQCPRCGRFFCRECITEHEGRITCATCLEGALTSGETRRSRAAAALQGLQTLAGILVVWLIAYGLGRALAAIPTAFHDGTLLRAPWWDQ